MLFKNVILTVASLILFSAASEAQEATLPAGARLVGRHVVFDEYKNAADWLRPDSARIRRDWGAEKFEILPEGGTQATVQGYVNELWGGFQQLFPEATRDLPAPILILVDSDGGNAFVVPEKGNVVHAVVATTQLIADAGGLEQKLALTGILAHEMAHSVFLSGLKDKDDAIVHFLKMQKGTPDSNVARDAALQSKMETYLDAFHNTGELTDRELHSLPSNAVMEQATLSDFFQRILRTIMSSRKECRRIQDLGAQRDRLISLSSLNFRVEIAPEKRAKLDEVSGLLVENLKACAGTQRLPFGPTYASIVRKPLETLRQKDSFNKMEAAFDGAPDVITGLQAAVEVDRQTMRGIQAEIDVNQVGLYTIEQFADDVSALVHAQLGRDPSAYNQLLGFYMEQTETGLVEQCRKISQDGARPPLGSFNSPHHTYCYRIYNLETMKRALEKASSIKEFAKEFVMRTTRENP